MDLEVLRRQTGCNQKGLVDFSEDKKKYLKLLSREYPEISSVCRELINLEAILNLPKGTEHFMSDIHGEYGAFYHIMNNASGVIREKVDLFLGEELTLEQRQEICTVIYYPEEKLQMLREKDVLTEKWYRQCLLRLIFLARHLSSKYTRSKVRKALPEDFAYIIEELMYVQPDEDNNQLIYHEKILDTILQTGSADAFIYALTKLIKRLAVDHLHIVGDIFDRGSQADKIMDLLTEYHSLDIQWGNHDILWMGAACGCEACIANVLRNSMKYNHISILENTYGISLRSLVLFAERTYPKLTPMKAAMHAISVILFKLEGQIILRHPEYEMQDRLLLDKINIVQGTVQIAGKRYPLMQTFFPTLQTNDPYELMDDEYELMDELRDAFEQSEVLQRHIRFLYEKGSIYCCYNGNLLFHGCIPLDEKGNFDGLYINGTYYAGKAYLDCAQKIARLAYFQGGRNNLDFMWYLWCGKKSPLSGRNVKTFERTFLADESTWYEEKNPYYVLYEKEEICRQILMEFGLFEEQSHIINGHTPISVKSGESPLKANNRLIVIDGGFCKAYQRTTGIAGYTLIYNSHGMRIKAHKPFTDIEGALLDNSDIDSESHFFEKRERRMMIRDTDNGKQLLEKIEDLKLLLEVYRNGISL